MSEFTYKIEPEMHHSEVEFRAVEHAHRVYNELKQFEMGEVPIHPWGHEIKAKELAVRASSALEDLLQIIGRITAAKPACGRCAGTGAVMERMGGCRDEIESVVCPVCHGRFLV